jgi:hypothetical protein
MVSVFVVAVVFTFWNVGSPNRKRNRRSVHPISIRTKSALRSRFGCSLTFGELTELSCVGKGKMNRLIRFSFVAACLAAAMFVSVALGAQQKPQSVPLQRQSYDPSREVSLQGVVLSFTENSSTPPLGARVSVQTSSGTLDVHLGSAKLLQANHFTLAAGDSVRIVGESLPFGAGSQFFARIIQKGNQSVALRSTRGFPLRPSGKQAGAQ